MSHTITRVLAVACVGLFVLQGVAFAGVEVSVTLTGDLDDILSVLQALRDQRGGQVVGQPDENMKVQVHSMAVGTIEESPAAGSPRAQLSPIAPNALPQAGFSGASIEPSAPSPGASVMVAVRLQDPRHQVDTVSVRLNVPGGFAFDLFDNGGYGDEQAGDGLWKRQITLPGDLAPGDVTATFTAFDVNGQTVTVARADGTSAPLRETAVLHITGPQPSAAPSAPQTAGPPAAAPSPDR